MRQFFIVGLVFSFVDGLWWTKDCRVNSLNLFLIIIQSTRGDTKTKSSWWNMSLKIIRFESVGRSLSVNHRREMSCYEHVEYFSHSSPSQSFKVQLQLCLKLSFVLWFLRLMQLSWWMIGSGREVSVGLFLTILLKAGTQHNGASCSRLALNFPLQKKLGPAYWLSHSFPMY